MEEIIRDAQSSDTRETSGWRTVKFLNESDNESLNIHMWTESTEASYPSKLQNFINKHNFSLASSQKLVQSCSNEDISSQNMIALTQLFKKGC